MKKLFSTNGDRVGIIKLNPDNTSEKLQPRVYSVGYNQIVGFYLNIIKDDFDVPDVIFGDYKKRAEKVMNTYNARSTSTGVLLTGNKGSGKSMISELIANMAIEQGLPVILVNEEFTGDTFTSFMDDIGECVLFFDEFAKVYEDSQDGLLSLLDGTMSRKRLIMMTENKTTRINEFMLNRPGRIFYHFKYDKIGEDFITEFCEYHNVAEIVEDLKYIRSTAIEFSVDVVQAIVEEYKRYGGKVDDIVKDMNIDVGNIIKTKLIVERVMKDDIEVELDKVVTQTFEVDLSDHRHEFLFKLAAGHLKKTNNGESNLASDVEDADDDEDTYRWLGTRNMKFDTFTHVIYESDGYVMKFRKDYGTNAKFNWEAF